MIALLPAVRVQEFCKVVGVLVGIIEGRGLLVLPCGYGMSILLMHKYQDEVQVGYLSVHDGWFRYARHVFHSEFGTGMCSATSKKEM